MAALQGFEEINITKPIATMTMTVMQSRIRFNKATATALGYPAYVKVLINEKTKQVALEVCTGRETNAVKFSKPEGKQTASVSITEDALVTTVAKLFTFESAPEGEVSYQLVNGKLLNAKAAVFTAADAKAGTMKRRGRKKSTN